MSTGGGVEPPVSGATAAPEVARAPGSTLYAGWALGAFCTSVLINSTGLLHLRFMTDSLGIGAALAGTLLAISRVYDGVIDPLMGAVSDRTRSRWGRRRPWLLLGSLMCGLAMVGKFVVPDFESPSMLAAWMTLVLLFFATAYTTFRIPYLAMGADLSRSFEGRSRLMTFQVYGSSIGSLVATTAAPFLLAMQGGGRGSHEFMALVLGALILLSGLATFRLTAWAPEGVLTARQHYTWRERFSALAQNRPFVVLIIAKTLLFIGLALHLSAVAYFVRHVLQLNDFSLGTVFLMRTLATIASQAMWPRVAASLGRRNALIIAILCDVAMFGAWWLIPVEGADRWLVALGLLGGVAGGGIFFNIQCMLPDTMDYDAKRFGLRREGMFAGIFVMTEKFTSAIATAMFGAFIGFMGYVAAADVGAVQPASAITAIRLSVSVLPAALMLLSIGVLLGYRLPPAER